MENRFRLPRAYKLLLALTVVVGPFIWLVFTEDGQRRSDLFLLNLLGRHGFNIAFERLHDGVTEADLRAQFPRADLQCGDASSPFGDRACVAGIASYNGVPVRSVTAYLQADELRALRIDYRPRYRHLLLTELQAQHGHPKEQSSSTEPVLRWQLPGGALLLPAVPVRDVADAALIWVSTGAGGP